MRVLDTNIIIFHILDDNRFGKKASRIIERIEQGENVFVPLAVLKETLFVLLAHGKSISEIMQMLFLFQKDNIQIIEDDFAVFLEGLQIAKKYEINPTDGVIIALMFKHNVFEIYSNDEHFDKIPGIKRIF